MRLLPLAARAVAVAVLCASSVLAQTGVTVTPATLAATAPAGQTATATAVVRNGGGAPVTVSLPQFAAPVPAGASAPDAYGYRWTPSDAPGGPVFEALDVSPAAGGTGVALDFGTDEGTTVDLPFAFPFYGAAYASMQVYQDGFVTFDEAPVQYPSGDQQTWPDPRAPNNLIAVFWEQIRYAPVSRVYTATLPDGRFVVQYDRVRLGNLPPLNTALIILSPDGTIVLQYPVVDPNAYAFSLGIENQDGTAALGLNSYIEGVGQGDAVRFSNRPPIVASATPSTLALAPGASATVAVTFTAAGLTVGTYAHELVVVSGGTVQRVPLQLTVTGESRLSVTPGDVVFGPVALGQTRRALVTLENTGAQTLQISSITLAGAGYATTFSGPITLAPREQVAGTVSFTATATGTAAGALILASSDPAAPTRTVALSAEGVLAPALVVEPATVAAVVPAGGSATAAVTLRNAGAGPLAFAFPGFETRRSGGPDASGHWWTDSDDPAGPAYDWIDITRTGTRAVLSFGTDHAAGIPLPFPFPFYGQTKTTVGINGNGFLAFGEVGSSTSVSFSDPLPSEYVPNDLIAVYWDYLAPDLGEIYYQDMADGRFVVTWADVPNYLDSFRDNTFQAVLYEDGTILFQYLDVTSVYRDHVAVGMENATGTEGLQVAYREQYVESGLAVRLSTGLPLVSGVTPQRGTIAPGASASVTVALDALDLDGGTYDGGLRLDTNDPARAHTTIPVSVVVQGEAALSVTPAVVAFGSVVVGQTETAVLTLRNAGTEALAVTGVTAAAPFSAPAGGFTLAPGASRTLAVTFAPTTTGGSSVGLVVASGSPDVPSVTVPLAGEGALAPALVVAPAAIVGEAPAGQETTATLTLQNDGAGPLSFQFPQFSDGAAARAGGPDAFGYRWADSAEPGGPAFDWTDVSATGTLVAGDETVQLPFEFFLYGQPHHAVHVLREGVLVFEPYTQYGPPRPIPNDYGPNAVVAPFWNGTRSGGQVHTATLPDGRFVVQWTAIPGAGTPSGSTNTFQAILERDHSVTFQYLQVGAQSTGNPVIVGIENATGTVGTLVAHASPLNNYNSSGLPRGGQAVRITAPSAFISGVAPAAGTLAPGASAEVTVRLSAAGLVEGTYAAGLVLTSNDPQRARVEIPTTLAVSGAPAITATPAAVDVASVFVGARAEARVVVTNTGSQALAVSDVTVTGAGFSVESANPFTLAPLASDTLTVRFVPTEVGAVAGALRLASNAVGLAELVVPLAGVAVAPPAASVSATIIPATVPQGQTRTRSFTLSNTGPSPMTYRIRTAPGGLPLPQFPTRTATRAPGMAARTAPGASGDLARQDGTAGETRRRGQLPETVPFEQSGPGDIVFTGYFSTPAGYGPEALTVDLDGRVYVVSERDGWTARYTPSLIADGTFRHPMTREGEHTRGVAYNEDTQTLWYLNALRHEGTTYSDYSQLLIEAELDGTATGRTVVLPESPNGQYGWGYSGLSYNERTGLFYTLERGTDDIYAFTPQGEIAPGYPVPQTSTDDGEAEFEGQGIDAWGDYLDVPFGASSTLRVQRIVTTDLAGADVGVVTPIAVNVNLPADAGPVRSRTRPNDLMYFAAYDAVWAVRPAVRHDLKPFVRVTSDSTGVLAAGASVEVEVTFDPLDLPENFYARRVRIETDSPLTPSLSVACQVLVVPPGATAGESDAAPAEYALWRNQPNPLSGSTRIRYALPEAGAVTLRVYDALGRLVATLVDGERPAGTHEAVWQTSGAATGVYVYRLEAGAFSQSKRMVVVR